MRTLILLAGLVSIVGCGGSSSPGDRLVGNWLYVASSGNAGIAADYSSNGTYVAALMVLTSTTTAEAQVEKGTYSVSGDQLTSVPTEWTCPGPDAIDTATFSFSGSDLLISTSSGVIALTPNTAPVDTSFVLTYGCFDSSGNFTASPLAPVSN
jgi:hypothetical protein